MTTPNLFAPIKLRGRPLKNRIVFGAHTANMSENGYPGAQHRAYYEERAMGGAAMIVVEPMPVHATGVLTRGNFRHDDDSVIPHFAKLVEGVKTHDTVILQQLYHIGQHGDADLSFQPNWSPSGLPSYHDSDGSHAMSMAQIDEIVEGHVQAALRCQKAGFDGVEIWNAYHSIVDQYLTPWSNHRQDEYGGSLENRMRFGGRIFEAVRAAVGEDFIIGFSLSLSEETDFMLSVDDYIEILSIWDKKGYFDYVSVGTGNYVDYERVMPTFVHGEKLSTPYTIRIKSALENALVIAESHIRTPENAKAVIDSGEADLVSIVRGQIADPHWVNKTREGREEDVRGCISCNQMCWGRRSRDYWISCLINPSAGREREWGGDRFTQTIASAKVLIVGAGPAGMEAARVAAERGHQVTLVEASSDLGGAFRLGALAPRRGQILELINWYQR
ncbi:MAG: 2,4-dienoyl-CoA reductase-like NADH-dependent reductase (Old Yellow Enzyme family) [Saprospiraceae bacterium]|jgi:2,4-dienoyl-CoA reductase-like NADH-dependent reductase (Old Yellow Enzyme family)